MSTLTSRPMSLLRVEFDELYARHLCRHSQTGVNVVHLIALFATWYAVYGLLHWTIGTEWVLGVPALMYLTAIAPYVPIRLFVATALFLGLIIAAVIWLPAPWWVYAIMIPAFYKIQAWSHKFYTVEFDMTEFNKKYTKGVVLFVVLLFYEVPIVLYFLLFTRSPAPDVAGLNKQSQETAAAKAS